VQTPALQQQQQKKKKKKKERKITKSKKGLGTWLK
jgi:hypothetical protein